MISSNLVPSLYPGLSPDVSSTHSLAGSLPTGEHSNLFSGAFQQAASTLQKLNDDASSKVRGLLSGDGTDIHTAMIATQKASLAFEAALAIRNKAVGSYQQIMGMQF